MKYTSFRYEVKQQVILDILCRYIYVLTHYSLAGLQNKLLQFFIRTTITFLSFNLHFIVVKIIYMIYYKTKFTYLTYPLVMIIIKRVNALGTYK